MQLIGIGLGPTIGGIMNQLILTIGACYLLFEGGATLRFAVLKQIWITLTVISTLGVLITGAIITYAGVWLGIPIGIALVLGALTASIDPATRRQRK